jgi:hypothetical protein
VVTFNNHGMVQQIPLVKAGPISTPTPVVMNSAFNPPGAAPGGYNNPNGGGNAARFGNRFGQNQNQNTGNNGSSAATRNQPQLSTEETELLITAQKAQLKQAGDPTWKLFPPTGMDKDAGTENSGSPPGP